MAEPSVVRYRRAGGVKRAMDLGITLAVMPLLLPVLGIVALAVRLDSPGPIFFRQQRTGRHGVRFGMFKFRTMVENAEELKASLAHLNVLPPPDFKIPDDPRVTRVGKLLRKTSLDELPQFLNVLKGDMSIVGPRPAEDGMDTYRLWYGERLEVPPGITGIWQLEGRAAISFDERLRYDLEYIRTMSLWLDLKLIVRTIAVVFKGTGV